MLAAPESLKQARLRIPVPLFPQALDETVDCARPGAIIISAQVHRVASTTLLRSRGLFGFLCASLLISTALAQSIAVSTPRAGAVIGGTSYTLSSSLTSLPAAYSVEYDVSSEVACIAVRAPFSCSWNTYYFFGGPAGVVAIARDAANNVLATSTQVGFTVHNPLPSNNPNNTFSVTPSIAWTSAWRGTVSFKIAEGSNISGDFMYLNGAAIGKTANESPQYYLDTSRWRNGRYRIVFVFTAADGLNGQWNQIGQVERSVTFSNGSAAMELHNSAHEIPLCTTARPDCPAELHAYFPRLSHGRDQRGCNEFGVLQR